MKKKLLLLLLIPVFAYSTELWSEFYSESVYRSEPLSLQNNFYGTATAGIAFSLLDVYAVSHRYMLTDGIFDIGSGIRKSIQISNVFLNPFGEILLQKDNDIGVKIGVFVSYRKKL